MLAHDAGGVAEYDLVIVGGGTAGQTVALGAREAGFSVAFVDHVRPSDLGGATWPNFLGTCAAVGCVPKKLMHELAALCASVKDTRALWPEFVQWDDAAVWERATRLVLQHMQESAAGTERQLRAAGVQLYPFKARMLHEGQVQVGDAGQMLRARKALVVATGTRPLIEPYTSAVPSKQKRAWRLLTSDEVFHAPTAPGRTLVVGGSYVAVEVATILAGLGFSTTLMMRSVPLRGFEDAAVEHVLADLVSRYGVDIQTGTVPEKWEDIGGNRVQVTSTDGNCGTYNTVVLAIGRAADRGPESLGADLVRLGAVVNDQGRLVTDANDAVEGLDGSTFALGDVAARWPELQSVAGAAARCFVARLIEERPTSYVRGYLPVTIYAGLELGSVGETAREARGRLAAACRVFVAAARPLRLPMQGARETKAGCHATVVCDANKDLRVVGCHLAMPHAADAIQGIALAMNMGLTLRNWRDLVPVHPTDLESLVFNLRAVADTPEETQQAEEPAEAIGALGEEDECAGC